jgi:hypothetical protein
VGGGGGVVSSANGGSSGLKIGRNDLLVDC